MPNGPLPRNEAGATGGKRSYTKPVEKKAKRLYRKDMSEEAWKAHKADISKRGYQNYRERNGELIKVRRKEQYLEKKAGQRAAAPSDTGEPSTDNRVSGLSLPFPADPASFRKQDRTAAGDENIPSYGRRALR